MLDSDNLEFYQEIDDSENEEGSRLHKYIELQDEWSEQEAPMIFQPKGDPQD